jgi:hypothetical protein
MLPGCVLRFRNWQLGRAGKETITSASRHFFERPNVFRNHEYRLIPDQMKVLESLLRYFKMNESAPFGNRLHFDEGACGVDVLDSSPVVF